MIDANLVLIHGFWSSPATWDRLNRRLREDSELDGIALRPFGYESPKLSWRPWARIPNFDDIAQSLNAHLSEFADQDRTAIVTHSQGGLILQRYLAWMLAEGRGRELAPIKIIIMLACPNSGTEILRSIRSMAGLGRHPQARDLQVLQENVIDANRVVLRQIVNAAGINERECRIPIYTYGGRTDEVVRRGSAQAAFPQPEMLAGDHFSILDPDARYSQTLPMLKRHLFATFSRAARLEFLGAASIADLPPVVVGRDRELATLHRWTADESVRLVAVNGWGGAGKTTLVGQWLRGLDETRARTVFIWDFTVDSSVENWSRALVTRVGDELDLDLTSAGTIGAVLRVLRTTPSILVLDGLETLQAGPNSERYGRMLSGTLRHVLTGVCRLEQRTLVVLTSRFPFADLATFDGTRARVLDIPPLSPDDGAALLQAADPKELTSAECRALAARVDGHPLALSAMAALLRTQSDEVPSELTKQLVAAGRTDEKVGRVLAFYAERLSPGHRYLVAAVSLFNQHVDIRQILAVAQHPVFAAYRDGWDEYTIQAAARGVLAGLLRWHHDGTVSAHPLVRDAFRPLAMGAARVAADLVLTGVAGGRLSDQAQAAQLAEAIELCIEAGEWHAADNLYRSHSDDGALWQTLPAVSLGRRAALAFIGDDAREQACARALQRRAVGRYLNDAAMLSIFSGDLNSGRLLLERLVSRARENGPTSLLVRALCDLAGCLCRLGRPHPAMEVAAEAQHLAYRLKSTELIADAHTVAGWAADVGGRTADADHHFLAADRAEFPDPGEGHVFSQIGLRWADFLGRTGRVAAAVALTHANVKRLADSDRRDDITRCQVLLRRLNEPHASRASDSNAMAAAIRYFRDGDQLIDLAETLAAAADAAQSADDLELAAEYAAEALGIAAPRDLVPVQARALITQARITAARDVPRARDQLDSALRLATGNAPLPWIEFAALNAQAELDAGQRTDSGARDRAAALYAQLVPVGLEPDPLRTGSIH
ncbi:MAG TPA: hypothetical protein VFB74_29660 [Kribbellaceae bacterium]|nr:hypothetical protein [Kribbellaceae bacterium]